MSKVFFRFIRLGSKFKFQLSKKPPPTPPQEGTKEKRQKEFPSFPPVGN
jgi:hypothetical protein